MEIGRKMFSFNISEKIILGLLGLYIILKPFYFWKSGLPQVSDFIMVLLIVVYLFSNDFRLRFHKESNALVYINLFFVTYILLINMIWALILKGEPFFLTITAFYLFNFMASLMIITLYKDFKDRLFKVIYLSTTISIIIQLVVYFLSGGFSGRRMVASFNNPNQLGYYTLLGLAILLVTSHKIRINFILFLTGIFATTVLCFASLSKAAIVAQIGMLMYFLLFRKKDKIVAKKLLILILVGVLAVLILLQFNSDFISANGLLQGVSHRIGTIGQSNDDNLYARGYTRILDLPNYLIFGAGEGAYWRFSTGMEFHSTLGNVFMSYGIIGLGTFLLSLFVVFRQNKWKDLYILAFIMAYGLTHNGIRNTFFWILITLISVASINRDTDKTVKTI